MIFDNVKRISRLTRLQSGSFAKIVTNQYKFLIDFQGLMYFDDQNIHNNPRNLIKDRKFIEKFYQSLKINEQQGLNSYRYIAQFWGQRNYLKYSISPVVYKSLNHASLQFSMGLKIPFSPSKLFLDRGQQLCYPFTSDHTVIKGIFSNQLSCSLLPMMSQSNGKITIRLEEKDYQLTVAK